MAKKKRAYQAMQSFMNITDPMAIAQIAGRAAGMQGQHNQFNKQMGERVRQFDAMLPIQKARAGAQLVNAGANATRAQTGVDVENRTRQYAPVKTAIAATKANTDAERVRLAGLKQRFESSPRGTQVAILKKIAAGSEPEIQQLILETVSDPSRALTGEMFGEALTAARKAKVRQGARETSAKEAARQTERTAGEVDRAAKVPNYRRDPVRDNALRQMASIANRIRKAQTEYGAVKGDAVPQLQQQLRNIASKHGIDPMEAVGMDMGGAPAQAPAQPQELAAPQVAPQVIQKAAATAGELVRSGRSEQEIDAILIDSFGPGILRALDGV